MKKNLVKMKKGIALFLLLLMLIPVVTPAVGIQAASEQFTIKVTMGYDKNQDVDIHVPVTITVTNNGADFNGSIQLTVPGREKGIMYEQELNLAKGATKKVQMAPMFYVDGEVSIAIVNKKGKKVQELREDTYISNIRNEIRVGVLSDDAAIARMLTNKQLISGMYSQLILNAFDLKAEDIFESYEALESLDVIIISNFSTDILSDKQIQAIMDWVKNGGLLLIGTGDSYKKTMEGFNGVLKYTDNGLINVNTDFAVHNISEMNAMVMPKYSIGDVGKVLNQYDYSLQQVKYDMTINQDYKNFELVVQDMVENGIFTKVDDYFDFFWEKYAFEIADHFYYTGLWIGGEYTDIVGSFKELYYSAQQGSTAFTYLQFKNYCRQVVYNALIADVFRSLDVDYYQACEKFLSFEVLEEFWNYGDPVVSFSYVDATLWDFNYGNNKIVSSDPATGKQHTVFNYEQVGNGNVILAAMDFSKNPFVKYEGASQLLVQLVENFIGNEMLIRMKNYNPSYWGWGHGIGAALEELVYHLESLTPVPVLVYLLLFVAYIMACFIFFNVLKKKKKSLLLWPIITGLAVLSSILVFFVSFSTKAVKPVMNVVKIVNAGDASGMAKSYCSVTLPKNKVYKVSFREDVSVKYMDLFFGSHYVQPSVDSYGVGFSNKGGKNTVLFNNTEVLATQMLEITENNYKHGDIDFKGIYSCGILSGSITNNYGHDLDNCSIILEACVVPIGTFKNGETIDLATLTPVGTQDHSYNYSVSPRDVKNKAIFGNKSAAKAIMLGIGGKDIVKQNAKIKAQDYIIADRGINGVNDYISYGAYNGMLTSHNLPLLTTADLYFVGYNSRVESIADGDVSEILTEVVYKEASK